MVKLLSKLSISSCLLSGVIFLNLPQSNQDLKRQSKINLASKKLEVISTIDDIELFEKENNCSFSFVGSWGTKEVYTVKEFLNKKYSNIDENKIIKGAETFKTNCKEKGSVALFYGGQNGRFGLDSNAFQK